ncbi:DNA polymerase IV [Spectribacter hydrogenoxidans]|uniref:DNA polymerase IV n=1 Tax=Spectribacter hydrogenoxidans TaxID=3075608 RepID=A0ABU3BZK6_9GAMM|nr:DNA polymerase IV [Salinisphaera sp. W335]MDT0634736.1 DNA polymerase IV [Salinisphaera sp. W335]
MNTRNGVEPAPAPGAGGSASVRPPAGAEPVRKILHVDMDAFYASVEQRDDPRLAGRPVIVGGRPEGRGVVAAASYEARAFGIHSAMPCARALRLCPEAVVVRPRFDVYRAVSRQIQALFRDITPLVEPLSLDEAYLDVTGSDVCAGSATRIARLLKQRIRDTTGLTASAGVSTNKMLAKLASAMEKPDGLTVIAPGQAAALLTDLPVARLPGVGPATARRLADLGLTTCRDLASYPAAGLAAALGRAGTRLGELARGEDTRPVRPDRPRKSVGAETTFDRDLRDPEALDAVLDELAAKVARRLADGRVGGRRVTLKLRYANFDTVTRSTTLPVPDHRAEWLRSVAASLLQRTEAGTRPARLLGITVGDLVALAPTGGQAGLFDD